MLIWTQKDNKCRPEDNKRVKVKRLHCSSWWKDKTIKLDSSHGAGGRYEAALPSLRHQGGITYQLQSRDPAETSRDPVTAQSAILDGCYCTFADIKLPSHTRYWISTLPFSFTDNANITVSESQN